MPLASHTQFRISFNRHQHSTAFRICICILKRKWNHDFGYTDTLFLVFGIPEQFSSFFGLSCIIHCMLLEFQSICLYVYFDTQFEWLNIKRICYENRYNDMYWMDESGTCAYQYCLRFDTIFICDGLFAIVIWHTFSRSLSLPFSLSSFLALSLSYWTNNRRFIQVDDEFFAPKL